MNGGSLKRAKAITRALVDLLVERAEKDHGAILETTLHYMEEHGLPREICHLPQLLKEAWYQRAKERTATVLTPSGNLGEERNTLASTLEKIVGKKIIFEEDRAPALLGGAVLAIGDERLDGSLRGALTKIGATLAAPSPLAS